MRRLCMLALAVVLGAPVANAGEPGGDRRGPGNRGRGGDRGGMMQPMGRRNRGTDVFDVARHTSQLPDDKQASLDALAIQYAVEENEAIAALRQELNKKYLVSILALLPEEDKPKYEKAIAALTARDVAIAAAQTELRGVLDKIKVSQGADKVKQADQAGGGFRFFQPDRGEVPTRKIDALQACFVLTQAQGEDIHEVHDGNRNAARDRMRQQFARLRGDGGRPDPAAMRQMGQLFRQVSDETDNKDAEAVVQFLTDAQKKDFATVCTAVDTYRKKTADAETACRKAVNEAVGEEKANAILGPPLQAAGGAAAGGANKAQF